MIKFTSPLLWNMAGYLLLELREYMMTKRMPGKEAMSLVVFVTMSQQLVKILKTKKMKERQMTPLFKPRRPMLLMMTMMDSCCGT